MTEFTVLLTVLVCTHDRADLLRRVLESLNAAERPANWQVRILVVANNCSDGTHGLLEDYRQAADARRLALDWLAEPRPGKSHALNAAIPAVGGSDIVAFVDDDHRVDSGYLVEVCKAADAYPDSSMFCGRILPDWDGSEPTWVHDNGPYRIYPLPVPRFDGGEDTREVAVDGPKPGGGNLFLRGGVLRRSGGFSTDLGPRGHDLGGGEDTLFVELALRRGERLRYVPGVKQYHYVDLARFKLGYLVNKAFHRSRSITRVRRREAGRVPLFMYRKLAEYGLKVLFSWSGARRRFYLVRTAATLGEIRGLAEARPWHDA